MSELEWRYLPDLPTYGISRDGRILGPRGKVLAGSPRNGYLLISTQKNRKRRTWSVHRLVAMAWIGPAPSPKHEVCHRDGIRDNNHVENLYWGTHSENLKDAVKHGTRYQPDVRGERHPQAKLTWEKVREIREACETGATQVSVARLYGVSIQTVSRIVRGDSWRVEGESNPKAVQVARKRPRCAVCGRILRSRQTGPTPMGSLCRHKNRSKRP